MNSVQHAHALAQAGDLEAAARLCRSILSAQPRHDYALFLLGTIEAQLGRLDDAEKFLGEAVKVNPRSPDALTSYGGVLLQKKHPIEAVAMLSRALVVNPRNTNALILRGESFALAEKPEDALRDFDRVLEIDPRSAIALHHRAQLLIQLKRPREALTACEKAISLDPKSVSAHMSGANILMDQLRLDEALSWVENAIAADKSYAPAHVLRGNILLHLGRHDESLASYNTAVAAAPDYAEAHYHRGSALLLKGKFKDGLTDFEYRWGALDCGFDRPKLNAQEWRGESLEGKSIVVYSEQGLGDTIQFVRFLRMLPRAGTKLTFLCHPNLILLFRDITSGMETIATCDAGRHFDFQCALMSLPHWLGTELSTIPSPIRYLSAEDDLIARWREKIGVQGLKIGIGWQGNPRGQIDKGRSVPLSSFAPLAEVPGVRLISVQKNHGLDQLATLPAGMKVETLGDFDPGGDAFVDTAAIMQCLDLVVTSDTATPHLAGALGVPTWVALKHVPDWRWMLDRNDSPWYPSLRLFRQETRGNWRGVFVRMAEELRPLAKNRAPGNGE
jgi:tetratricopeptide (TPR) repeat protein